MTAMVTLYRTIMADILSNIVGLLVLAGVLFAIYKYAVKPRIDAKKGKGAGGTAPPVEPKFPDKDKA